MRTVMFLLILSAVLVAGACYERPKIPLERPLACEGTDAGNDCPSGLTCIMRICAPLSCAEDVDCPGDLVCIENRGCRLPGSFPDGGAGPAFDGAPPGPGSTLDGPPLPGLDASMSLFDGGS